MFAAPEVKKSLIVLMFLLFVTSAACAAEHPHPCPSIEPGRFEVIEVVP